MDRLNIGKFEKAEDAAKALYEFVRERCKEQGGNPDIETFLHDPEKSEAQGTGRGWHVCWESGPFEWAIWLSGGESMNRGEFPSGKGEPEVYGFYEQSWLAEPYWSFGLVFYEEA